VWNECGGGAAVCDRLRSGKCIIEEAEWSEEEEQEEEAGNPESLLSDQSESLGNATTLLAHSLRAHHVIVTQKGSRKEKQRGRTASFERKRKKKIRNVMIMNS